MNAEDQSATLQAAITAAPDGVSVRDAMQKMHSEYIRRQMNNKGFASVSGFLVAAGFVENPNPPDGWLNASRRMRNIFDNYLSMKSKLTGEKGLALRAAMDKFGIDYKNSPVYPLEPVDQPQKAA